MSGILNASLLVFSFVSAWERGYSLETRSTSASCSQISTELRWWHRQERIYATHFPLLWKLPTWIAPFKRQLAGYFEIADKYYRGLQDDIAAQMRSGTAVDCWQKRNLENKGDFGMNDQQASWAVGAMLAAGMPTTAAVLLSFLQAIVHHPEWQGKVQTEVDDVVGGERLPDYDDMPRLPTGRAVLKETLRWRPVTAGGLPHMLKKDDAYEGYFLPKGSIVHANQW